MNCYHSAFTQVKILELHGGVLVAVLEDSSATQEGGRHYSLPWQ